MFYPSPLKLGDTVGLIAPCSPVKPERLLQCINVVSAMGLLPVLGNSTMDSLHGYLAGSDEARANDINQFFADPDITAIFCIRGGYGSTRIMDLLDYEMIRQNPKIFVGYSDITTFHLAFYSLCHLITFHGPMVSSNIIDDYDSYTKQSFLETLAMPKRLHFHNPANHCMKVIVPGCAKGRIVGGCLSLVAPSIGTFYQPNFRGKILFLEDVDESIPRCDKLMQQLIHSGILDQVTGIILGNFKDCTNPYDSTYTIYDYFRDFFEHYTKPVVYGVWSGHEKPMGTIPLGTVCTIDTNQNNTISFDFR